MVTDAVVLTTGRSWWRTGTSGYVCWGLTVVSERAGTSPAHSFVVADDGRSVLLVTRTEARHELHRLDLTTRRMRYWTTLDAAHILPSYDGGASASWWIATACPSSMSWRSGRGSSRTSWARPAEPVLIGRAPDVLSALVDVPPAHAGARRSLELWVWELPGITLRMRRPLELPGDSRTGAVAGNEVRFLGEGGSFGQGLVAIRGWANPTAPDLVPNESSLTATGPVFALMSPTPDGGICVTLAGQDHPEVVLTYPERRPIGVRWHAGVVTVWDDAGRVVAVDTAEGRVVASMRSAG